MFVHRERERERESGVGTGALRRTPSPKHNSHRDSIIDKRHRRNQIRPVWGQEQGIGLEHTHLPQITSKTSKKSTAENCSYRTIINSTRMQGYSMLLHYLERKLFKYRLNFKRNSISFSLLFPIKIYNILTNNLTIKIVEII